jgi:hypothetical protein
LRRATLAGATFNHTLRQPRAGIFLAKGPTDGPLLLSMNFSPRKMLAVLAAVAATGLAGSLALAQGFPGATPGATKNLLVNGSFEKGLEGWTVDANQKIGKATIDQQELRNGKPTLRVDNPQPDDVHVKQTITVEPNTRYRFEGYIKTKDVEPAKRDGKDGACLAIEGGYKKSQIVSKTRGWTKVTLEFITGSEPQVTLGTRLGFYYGITKGTAWYSDLSVERIGKAPPGAR